MHSLDVIDQTFLRFRTLEHEALLSLRDSRNTDHDTLMSTCSHAVVLDLLRIMQSNPTAADKMSQYLNVLQSVQLPFALIPLIHFCSRSELLLCW